MHITPPWADIHVHNMLDILVPPQQLAYQQQCRRQQGRRWKHLAESFPETCRSVCDTIGTGTLFVVEQSSFESHLRWG